MTLIHTFWTHGVALLVGLVGGWVGKSKFGTPKAAAAAVVQDVKKL
jgi:hypothetical protein